MRRKIKQHIKNEARRKELIKEIEVWRNNYEYKSTQWRTYRDLIDVLEECEEE